MGSAGRIRLRMGILGEWCGVRYATCRGHMELGRLCLASEGHQNLVPLGWNCMPHLGERQERTGSCVGTSAARQEDAM